MPVTPNIDNGSADYTAKVNDIYGLIETIAKQTFFAVESANPLKVFDKEPIDKGTTIEQAMIQLTESYAFDKNAVDALSAKDPNFIVRYFQNWTEKQYEQSVRDDDIRKILIGSSSAENVASIIVGNLRESDDNETYETMKLVLETAKAEMTSAGTITTAEQLLLLIRNTIDSFKFLNANYSIAGAEHRTPLSRIRVVMPYQIKNTIDVETLAQTFHMEKAEIEARIDTIDSDDGIVYIVDENAILHHTRLSEIESQRNAKGRVTNYYLTKSDMFAYSPLFKMTYIDASALLPTPPVVEASILKVNNSKSDIIK